MFSGKCIKYGLMFFSLFFFLTYVLELDAYARAGRGGSFGSRGSRSYTAPKAPAAAPSAPSRQMSPAPATPMMTPQSGGFMRSLAGGLIGGMIGGMLFRSLGFGGDGTTGGGIGLFDIALIGLVLYGIWWYISRRRQEALATSGASYYRDAPASVSREPADAPSHGRQAPESDLETGLSHIRQMDPAFDIQKFRDRCTDHFFKVQGAWANRDMSEIRNMLTDEIYHTLQNDADDLKRQKLINRLDNIAVRDVEVSEAWQEQGMDFITVRFHANLLDYTTEEAAGRVVSGSRTEPVKFEEFWTFTREAGSGAWQLAAIHQSS